MHHGRRSLEAATEFPVRVGPHPLAQVLGLVALARVRADLYC